MRPTTVGIAPREEERARARCLRGGIAKLRDVDLHLVAPVVARERHVDVARKAVRRVGLLVAGAIVFAGLRYAGFHPPEGFRAGVTVYISAFCAAVGIAVGVGRWLSTGTLVGGRQAWSLQA